MNTTTINLPFAVTAAHADYLCQVMPVVSMHFRRVVEQLRTPQTATYNKHTVQSLVEAFMRKAAPFAQTEYAFFFVLHATTALQQGADQALEDAAIDLYADYLYHDDYESVANIVKMISNL